MLLLLIFYIDSIGKYEKGITGDNMNYQSNMNTNNNAKKNVEDVKSKITRESPLYRMKKHMMLAIHGIEIIEV